MRQQMEKLFEKSNEKLIGTFKGTLEERQIKTSTTGKDFEL
jgi:hypothetical protein